MADYNSDRTGANIDATLDKVDALDAKVQPTATGANVTGSLTADGLTVDGNGAIKTDAGGILSIGSTDSTTTTGQLVGKIEFETSDLSTNATNVEIRAISNDIYGRTNLDFRTGDSGILKTRAIVKWDGDVEFFEDTGTTAKMVWDASAESLGIGTSSPNEKLTISDETPRISIIDNRTSGTWSAGKELGGIEWYTSDASGIGSHKIAGIEVLTGGANTASPDGELTFSTGPYNTVAAERMRIDSSGNVGIGESDPSGYWGQANHLVINDGNSGITIKSSSVGNGRLVFTDTKSTTSGLSDGGMITYGHATDVMTFQTAGTERARLDSSGNLLVGKSATNTINTVGHDFSSSGYVMHTRDSANVLYLNRKGNDGGLAVFQKDGSTVGSIGSGGSSTVYIGGGDTGLLFSPANNIISPWNTSTNLANDGNLNLGYWGGRFKDLYLSGGVYLGGTGAANKLDDYEEGDFTPVLTGSTSGTISGTGRYTKVGELVHIDIDFTGGFSGTVSGDVTITGMPFTKIVDTQVSVLSLTGARFSFDNTKLQIAQILSGESFIALVELVSGDVPTSMTGSSNFPSGVAKYFRVSGTYRTAS